MNRSSIVLILFLLLLPPALLDNHQAASSPLSAVQESDSVGFSYQGGTEWSGPLPIDQTAITARDGETGLQAMLPEAEALVTLQDGAAEVYRDGDLLWTSDPSWDVRRAVAADLDNDGLLEVALVLWKPFHREPAILYETFGFPCLWEEGSLRNHLFIYGWRNGAWQHLWCSSPVGDPILELAASDVDGDGANELVVLEGSYDAPDSAARHVTVWRWHGWGFILQWRSPVGAWDHLMLQDVTEDGVIDILVNQPN
jgi:hypothetical protein